MTTVLNDLAAGLDRDILLNIRARVEALQRHLRFLTISEDRLLSKIRRDGWSDEKLQVICELNAFYQMVLGPLGASSAARASDVLGGQIPIKFGDTFTFHLDRSRRIRAMMRSFGFRIHKLGIPMRALTAARASDILVALAANQAAEDPKSDQEEYDFDL